MNPKKNDELTVLIFKDNHASRTFRVPLSWISRFGFLLLIGMLMLATTTFFAAKFYRDIKVFDPTRVLELEKQLAEYEKQYEEVAESPTFSEDAESAPAVADGANSNPAEGYPPFRALPEAYRLAPADAPASVALKNIEVTVEEKRVGLRFWIQNTRRSGGNQTGRIIILARGPDTIRVYPKGALNPAGSASLLEPDRGEYFSINKFRETVAEFDIPQGRKADYLNEFEILILGKSNEILVTRRVPFTAAGIKGTGLRDLETDAKPAEKPAAKPARAERAAPPAPPVPQAGEPAASAVPASPAEPATPAEGEFSE